MRDPRAASITPLTSQRMHIISMVCLHTEQFWPHLAAMINKIGHELLPPLLRDSKPLWMGAIKLGKCVCLEGPKAQNPQRSVSSHCMSAYGSMHDDA